jgi:hypothetical protein
MPLSRLGNAHADSKCRLSPPHAFVEGKNVCKDTPFAELSLQERKYLLFSVRVFGAGKTAFSTY